MKTGTSELEEAEPDVCPQLLLLLLLVVVLLVATPPAHPFISHKSPTPTPTIVETVDVISAPFPLQVNTSQLRTENNGGKRGVPTTRAE